MDILVGITRGADINAVVKEIEALEGVRKVSLYKRLRSIVMVEVDETFSQNDVLRLNGVSGWADPANEIKITSQVDSTVTLTKGAVGAEAETAKWLQYQDPADVSLRELKNWWEFPRDVTYTEETDRLGANTVVCVIDTGIDTTHNEFTNEASRVERIYDIGDGNNGFHGTYTASEIAGATCGFLPLAKIIDCKVFNGTTGSGVVANGVAAIDEFIEWVETPANGVNDETILLVNMSFSEITGFGFNSYEDVMWELLERGIFPFAATGNNSADLDGTLNAWPAEGLKWTGTGAVDLSGRRAFFSNYSANVRMYGYGLHLPSAEAGTTDGLAWPSGTSMGCPNAVGAFGTWMGGRYRPVGLDTSEAILEDYLKNFCYAGVVWDDRGVTIPSDAVLARADNSPVENHVRVDEHEVVIYYDTAPADDILVTNDSSFLDGILTTDATKFDPDFSRHATRLTGFNNSTGPRISLAGENDIWIQFTMYRTGWFSTNGSGYFLTVPFTTGDPWIEVDLTGFNNMQMAQADSPAGTINNTAITSLGLDQLDVIDIHITKVNGVTPANADYEIFLNGVSEYSFSGSRGGGDIGDYLDLNGFRWVNDTESAYISNLRVSTTDTRNVDFRVDSLAELGTYDEFNENGFFDLIDGSSLRYTFADTDGARVSGTLDAATIPDNGTITAIALAARCRAEGPSIAVDEIAHFVRVGSTDFDQTAETTTRVRKQVVTVMATNPATSSAWVYADLATTEFGLVATASV